MSCFHVRFEVEEVPAVGGLVEEGRRLDLDLELDLDRDLDVERLLLRERDLLKLKMCSVVYTIPNKSSALFELLPESITTVASAS